MSPYFSIIIPVYRDKSRLKLCLDKIGKFSDTGFEFEVIVVNNDPGNPVLDLDPNQYPYSLKEIYEPIPGSYAARNKGIQESEGKIFGFTDSDCLPTDDWLAVAFNQFSKDKNQAIGILTGPVPLFYQNPNCLSDAELYEKYTGFTTESYAKEGHAITANWFSPASIIKEFGGFNAKLKSNGDSELSGRISKKYRIVYSPNLIVRHPARYHTNELVNKYKRLLGGAYTRKFQENHAAFRIHLFKFLWARYRFAIKRLFTLSPKESLPILRVCHAINLGSIQEYFNLIKGGKTKR
ncbi:glycosyltransferase family 2 protein [Cyclobacterium jeungdonense]|uniref:Glycosyltransferase family A protein n=1 Tax=Cyclobacterium jeungdonense TaxID=708087 RepID=A0ABT8CCQ0_9BACT|nr:glycosyltransferase family A protein [Cyclobacterium jeungdonense]MDN3690579.1 glycosyltransferase family A protein [Cyclobacterium jeungdonense]